MSCTYNLGLDSTGRLLMFSVRGEHYVLQRGAGHGFPQADIEISAEQMRAIIQILGTRA